MSGGYLYGQAEPATPCPYCKADCRADFVDIGVGMQQCGPYHCEACGASEIGSCDEERVLSADEKRTGWYAPGAQPGSSANVIGGKIVSHAEARDAYQAEFTGNPLWEDKEHVDRWWADQRAKVPE